MRRALIIAPLLLLAALGSLAPSAAARPAPRIIGGSVAAPTEAPWTAALVLRGRTAPEGQLCGGTVIAAQAVVTAAHCVVDAPSGAFDVVTGRQRLSDAAAGQRIAVAAIRVNPAYVDSTARNDVAVLLLATPTAAPALPLAGTGDGGLTAAGATLLLYGWGGVQSVDGSGSDDLKAGSMRALSDSACGRLWGSLYAPSGQVCAVGPDAGVPDACPGDSGSSLVGGQDAGARLVGIVSFGGERCGDPRAPTVFTRVSSYAGWIAQQAGGGSTSPPGQPDLTGVTLRFTRVACSSTCRADVLALGTGAGSLGGVTVHIRGRKTDRTFTARRLSDVNWRAKVGDLPLGTVKLVATALDAGGRVVGRRTKVTVRVVAG